MKFIVLVCLLSFCSFLDATPVNMTSEPNVFMKRISQTSWEQSNDIQFDSDVTLDTLEMIRKADYPAEAYVTITEDGYILTLHRIPGGNGSLPVLLQHGLLCTSADWLFLGKDKALAYLLADQGYDVWLSNYRGNTYSRKHISLSPSELKFWNFSFHEMGIYDLPAMITFITNMTSQPLHTYIGHSMGTTGFYIMASERPEIAQMVQKMISLSPVAFTNHMESKIKYLIPLWTELKMIIRYFFHDEFLPQSDILKFLSKYLCEQNLEENICVDIIFLICGYDREQFNYTLLPVILNHDLAGTSSKTLMHYVQIYQSGKFRQYDYGREKNQLIYNSAEPPDYNLSNITVPIALLYGRGDLIVNIVTLQPIILSDFLDGTSAKAMEHYAQGIQSGKFRKYDYGRARNQLIYNSAEPPDYNLANITVPSALFYGSGDLLVNIVVIRSRDLFVLVV
ncbi:Gastric triacylglycerol lipase [Camponotus floridanus]|uniref:Gastric triacylglycerol lipase n=1 Tax=Camponotus floridanus TaxID=104421 RepID=E1ZZM8_CAMFO|nr:Gastric triacylglycerol lipase [Camponotus floridanus]